MTEELKPAEAPETEELIPVEEPIDEKVATEGDDTTDPDDDEDERLGHEEGEDTDSANRRRRKQRREAQRRAREHQTERLAMLERQNAMMAQQLQQVQGYTLGMQEQQLAERAQQAEGDAAQADAIFAAAVSAGNGNDAAEAQRIRDAARAEAYQLSAAAQQLAQARNAQSQPVSRAPQVDPRVSKNAADWQAANPWFKPGGSDEASLLARQIDNDLVREGYNPATRDHWVELTNRLNDAFGDDEAPKQQRKGPPMGATREHATQNTRGNQIYVAPERKQAMIEAGIWDDPVRRQRALQEYKRFDEANPAR